jgi:DNA-sulfur modification-associated
MYTDCIKSKESIIMTTEQTLKTPQFPFGTRTCEFMGFQTRETLYSKGVNTTWLIRDLIQEFAMSPMVDDLEKLQRTLTPSRMKKLLAYLTPIEIPGNPGYPSLVTATLVPNTQRMLIDGQNRLTSFAKMVAILSEKAEAGDMFADELRESILKQTVDVKFVCTNTATLQDAAELIRQIFADYHKNVTKPTRAVNIFFDQRSAYSQALLTCIRTMKNDEELAGFSQQFSLEGDKSAVWDLSHFGTAYQRITASGESMLNNEYQQEPTLVDLHIKIALAAFRYIAAIPVIQSLNALNDANERKSVRNKYLCCTAIGLEAFGIVAERLLCQALEQSSGDIILADVLEPLARLADVNYDRDDPQWAIEVLTPAGAILKGSAMRMANILWAHMMSK